MCCDYGTCVKQQDEKYMQLRFWSCGGFGVGYYLSIAEFKNLRFIHREGWQQNNPHNISFIAKYVPGEIKKHEGYMNAFDVFGFLPNIKHIKNIKQMLFSFSGF